jgi:exosortase
MTTDLFRIRNRSRARLLWTGLCLLVLSGLLVWSLFPEWRLNPQYHYGFVVPFLVGLLVWRVREAMPEPVPREGACVTLALLAIVLALVAADIVVTSNPDWRLALWVYAGLVFLGSVLLLDWAGGWGRWFAAALGLLFFAIPWPTLIEQWAVQGLMRTVAAVTAEVCNLIGVPVEGRGNVLRLSSGDLVGVEDACSGVRSLQAGLMAAYFFSRWMWLSWRRTLLLLGFAAGLSFLFNLVRAIGLTLLAHFRGTEAVARWHDFAGNSVALLVFLVLLFVALRIECAPRSVRRAPADGKSIWLPVLAFVCLCGVPAFSWWWFSRDGLGQGGNDRGIAWAAIPSEVNYEPIAERSRVLLRYTEGEHGWWKSAEGLRFDLFDFHWERGMISSFGEIHRPDVCLPASGLEIVSRDLEWRELEVGGQRRVVERFAFEEGALRVYVFFCAWDLGTESGGEALVTEGVDRLGNALRGRRVEGRRVVQLLVSGAPDEPTVDGEVEALLGRVLR